MLVAYDPQTFLRQRAGGISRLFTDLISTFDAYPDMGVQAHPMFRWVNNTHAAEDLRSRGIRCTPGWLPREALYAPWVLRGLPNPGRVEIVHHTYYSKRFLRRVAPALRVTTVYDMIPERFAGTDLFTGSHLAKRDYVMASDLVIAISQSTLDDMLDHFGAVPGMTAVIPLAVGSGFHPNQPAVPGLPTDYLLYVGGRRGYKDFALLPQALKILEGRGEHVDVVVVGGEFTPAETQLLADLRVAHRFHRRGLDDALLHRAYANCVATVQTSRYEGFGMPPLEAMASGVPAVVARASSMPEVGGDVARYFEPGDAESLAAELAKLLGDTELRSTLSQQGVVRAANFTTARMAESTAAAYRSVLSG